MKKNIFLLLLTTLLAFSTYAQSSGTKTAQTSEVRVILAGITQASITIPQIRENPVVRIAQNQKQITSFDFAWTIKTESGSSEYEGPYHNTGDKLNAVTINDLLKFAANGVVTRIYIDNVYMLNSDGTSTRTKWGAAYKVAN